LQSLVTEDPITGCYGELCVSGNQVVLYEGLHPHNQTVRKVYSVESEVLQTFWCMFSESASSNDGGSSGEDHSLRCLCVREHTCLTLFMQTGGIHYIPLPFLVSAPQPIIPPPPFLHLSIPLPLHSPASPFLTLNTFHSLHGSHVQCRLSRNCYVTLPCQTPRESKAYEL